jgi:putative hydrolase of the HAD superfamily
MSSDAGPGPRFRAALFDLDDTLVDRVASFRRFTERFHETFPCVRATHTVEETYEAILAHDGWGHTPKDQVFSEVLRVWPGLGKSVEELIEFFWDELVAGMRPIDGVPEFLHDLNEAGVPWGIITNGDQRQHDKITIAGMDGLPPFVIATKLFGTGADKPDPAVFLEGLRRLGTEARDTLFVGDNPLRDIEGARRVGMSGAWVHQGREWPTEIDPPAFRVDHVGDLRPLLLGQGHTTRATGSKRLKGDA